MRRVRGNEQGAGVARSSPRRPAIRPFIYASRVAVTGRRDAPIGSIRVAWQFAATRAPFDPWPPAHE